MVCGSCGICNIRSRKNIVFGCGKCLFNLHDFCIIRILEDCRVLYSYLSEPRVVCLTVEISDACLELCACLIVCTVYRVCPAEEFIIAGVGVVVNVVNVSSIKYIVIGRCKRLCNSFKCFCAVCVLERYIIIICNLIELCIEGLAVK